MSLVRMRTSRLGLLTILVFVALGYSARVARAQMFTAGVKFDRTPEKVTWSNGAVQLSGVVVVPNTPRRHPAVVLVSGADKWKHDEPPLIAIANVFLKHGFAVLLYDKRGVGESTGDANSADFADFSGDVNTGVRMLRERNDIDQEHIGCLGISNGGWVCPLAAKNDPRIAFVVMVSGAPVMPIEQNLYWIAGRVRAHGGTEADVVAAQNARRRLWECYRDLSSGKILSENTAALRESLGADVLAVSKFLPEMGTKVWTPEVQGMPLIRNTANQMFYDGRATLRAMQAPLLAVFGDEDENVDTKAMLPELETLRKEGHRVDTHVFQGQGHTLVTKVMGIPRFAPGYLDLVTSWAAEIVGLKPK